MARGRGGFTLVEVLFTLAVSSFVLGGILTSYIFSVKGFRVVSNYNDMQTEGRKSLDWFARDVRIGIKVSSCVSNRLVLVLPRSVGGDGVVTASNIVTHAVQSGTWSRTDNSGSAKRLATGVTSLTFSLYDKAGNTTTQADQAVSVQVLARLTKSVQNKTQTTDFLSARFRMRNVP
jgi:prepilin-type N-terminal cleavage/methylation domain-containing protein